MINVFRFLIFEDKSSNSAALLYWNVPVSNGISSAVPNSILAFYRDCIVSVLNTVAPLDYAMIKTLGARCEIMLSPLLFLSTSLERYNVIQRLY